MKKKLFLLFAILIPGIILDQITKYLTRCNLADKPVKIIDGVLELTFLKNTGAAWGSFSNLTWLLTLVSIITVVIILWFYFNAPVAQNSRLWLLEILLVLIVTGAIGNMIDRIGFGYVTDMIYFKLINFPVFNVADIYVTCSSILLAITVIFYYKDEDFKWKND